jgi:predicted nucleotidyltransferase
MIAYKYLRGSWSHGIGVIGKSDYDYGGVFIAPKDMIIGFRDNYVEQVSDEKNDETYYEFGRWLELIRKQNPMALESLFVDKKYIIGNVHPAVQNILDHRYDFLSKECFKPLLSYSYTQIKKATGYNKKCHISEDFQRKDVLDFCYTFKNQGSQPIKEFLAENHLDQRYCGVVNIPNMKDTYGVYYDFAAYFKFEGIDSALDRYSILKNWYHGGDYEYTLHKIEYRIDNKEFFHYSGIVYPEDIEKSNEIRLSSIPKGERPICFMTYNKDAYTCHCSEYREYQEWVEKRNQKRYSKAVEAGYNQKNMCHCVRLLTMAKEISEGKGFNLWRTDDRDFLMGIKNGDYTYEYLIDYAEKLLADVEKNLPNSCLPDQVDKDFVNDLLVKCRKEYYGINC